MALPVQAALLACVVGRTYASDEIGTSFGSALLGGASSTGDASSFMAQLDKEFGSIGSLGGGSTPAAVPPALQSTYQVPHCTPQCKWQCETPKCNEVCTPLCQSPVCQTRCSGYDLSGCKIQCNKPQCAVICPEHSCPAGGCPMCTTKCSEPMCSLKCPSRQPCRNLCENPRCDWQCKAPTDCPKPKCHMVCETPGCVHSTYQQLPPLLPGESAVQSFAATSSANSTETASPNLSFLQRGSSHALKSSAGNRKISVPVMVLKHGSESPEEAVVRHQVLDLHATAM